MLASFNKCRQQLRTVLQREETSGKGREDHAFPRAMPHGTDGSVPLTLRFADVHTSQLSRDEKKARMEEEAVAAVSVQYRYICKYE
jgi:hypothetical protein